MHDIKDIVARLDCYIAVLARRGFVFDGSLFRELLSNKQKLQAIAESLQAERNKLSKEVGYLLAQANKENSVEASARANDLQSRVKAINNQLESHRDLVLQTKKDLKEFLDIVPNLLDDSVPNGIDENDNVVVRLHGSPRSIVQAKDHMLIGKYFDGIHVDKASKLAGARFGLLSGDVARLYRALVNYMLDTHNKRGYREYGALPHLVHAHCLYGTGQLPKFSDDIFFTSDNEYALIPTSEVVLANLVRDSIINAEELPHKYAAVSSCYRKEAGSYGKDTYGLIRQHQFDKVELVQVVNRGAGLQALDGLVVDAGYILEALELPYRVVLLCAGDTGFSARKTFDLEVWLPSQNCYREISSCSWCGDFQSRRMQARYKNAEGKTEFVETLNGSGLAVGRSLVAILENHQQEDGSVYLPEVLRPYLGGVEFLLPTSVL